MGEQVIELVDNSRPIVIELPPGSTAWVLGGVSVAVIWAVLQRVAQLYLRLLPWGRRLRPQWFAGSWDEWGEQVAKLLLRIDPRFRGHTRQEIAEVLRDPLAVAQLISAADPIDALREIVNEHPEREPQEQLRANRSRSGE